MHLFLIGYTVKDPNPFATLILLIVRHKFVCRDQSWAVITGELENHRDRQIKNIKIISIVRVQYSYRSCRQTTK